MSSPPTKPSDVALDNDIILKGVFYGLVLWPGPNEGARPGILGAARYVVGRRIDRTELNGDKAAAREALATLLTVAEELEPGEDELAFAAELERAAQEKDLDLDPGESQLAAVTIARAIPLLETGDKRAVAALQTLRSSDPRLKPLEGRVRCLEQAVKIRLGPNCEFLEQVSQAVCGEPAVDMTMSICFSCRSGGGASCEAVLSGLDSYIGALRTHAPEMLEP